MHSPLARALRNLDRYCVYASSSRTKLNRVKPTKCVLTITSQVLELLSVLLLHVCCWLDPTYPAIIVESEPQKRHKCKLMDFPLAIGTPYGLIYFVSIAHTHSYHQFIVLIL